MLSLIEGGGLETPLVENRHFPLPRAENEHGQPSCMQIRASPADLYPSDQRSRLDPRGNR